MMVVPREASTGYRQANVFKTVAVELHTSWSSDRVVQTVGFPCKLSSRLAFNSPVCPT